MQLQSIFIAMVLFFCIHDHILAIPIQQNEVSPNKKNSDRRTISSASYSQTCQFSSDCPAHSQCVSGACECITGWTTWKDSTLCAYEQKSKWTAFLLSVFVGSVGVDWFYLASGNAVYIVAGVFKLLMWFGCCHRFCKDKDDGLQACCACIGVILSIGSTIWWFVDWIRILTSVFPDGNGAPLYIS
jgi:hypothetical protein